MCLDGFFYDGKPKSGAFFVFAAGSVCLIETLPDFIQGIPGNPASVIFDGDVSFVSPFCCLNGDGRIRFAEFDGVVNEIVKNLLDFSLVGVYF